MLIYKCVIQKKHKKACCNYPGKIHFKKVAKIRAKILWVGPIHILYCVAKISIEDAEIMRTKQTLYEG